MGLPGHFRQNISAGDAEAIIRQGVIDRDDRFLKLLKHGVYEYLQSPYLPLLKSAGCEFGDVATMVRRDGLEATLQILLANGVSITFDEFKGRSCEVREGINAPLGARDFDNPHLSRYYTGTTGGSSGVGTRVSMDLDHYAAQAAHELMAVAAHDLLEAPTAAWLSVMPSPACLGVMLRRTPFHRPLAKWFTQVTHKEAGSTLKDRLASETILAASRMFRNPFPRPEHVPLDQAIRIARWLRHAADEHGASLLVTHVSCAARVARAAREAGIDLQGIVMWAGSEPPTPAKVGLIKASGAHWIPGYWMIEAGFLAQGCGTPLDATDVHLFSDAFAIVTSPQVIPGTDETVDSFYLTSLLPTASKLMINVEIDDFGVIERRRCDCPLGKLGLDTHLRQIHSLGKLTGEGMTLIGGTALRVLEEVLPAQCGGTTLDYQLLEEEDEKGMTKLILVASPKINTDDDTIRETFLAALDHSGPGATLARATWRQADSLQVRREEPLPTGQGKLLPLRSSSRKS